MKSNKHRALLIFDGDCNLCRCSVKFIINHDERKRFLFTRLNSEHAEKKLKELNKPENYRGLMVLMDGDAVYTRTTAILRVCKFLDGWWPALYAFIVVPKFIRDGLYNFISRNRYKWFGKSGSCMIPADVMKERFVD